MVGRTVIDYLRLLQSLLPFGKAWNRDEDSILTEFLYGQAEEFARVEGRSIDLLQERDTRLAYELLIDHETDLGLPDDCSTLSETIQERRRVAHSKLIAVGQQNPAYFIELAAALGWTVSITEYSPFWCDISVAGDSCGDQSSIFYWKVTIQLGVETIIYFTSGISQSGDPLSSLPEVDSMICTLGLYKPAHTVLMFDFDGFEYTVEYDSAFDSFPSSSESYLEGSYFRGFGFGFDVNWGGDFNKDVFGTGYKRPV